MNWGELFFSAEGRVGQKDFWLAVIVLSLFGVLVHLAPLIGAALWIVSIYCWICVYSKRLHDVGRTGWLQIAPWILSAVFLIFGGAAFVSALVGALAAGFIGLHPGLGIGLIVGGVGAGLGLLALSATAHLIFLLWLGLTRSQAGPNRFGPPPAAGTRDMGGV
jgi:uncharacterized membrane protein YhaH (DUF805 family)